jgi:hypothetical protein
MQPEAILVLVSWGSQDHGELEIPSQALILFTSQYVSSSITSLLF